MRAAARAVSPENSWYASSITTRPSLARAQPLDVGEGEARAGRVVGRAHDRDGGPARAGAARRSERLARRRRERASARSVARPRPARGSRSARTGSPPRIVRQQRVEREGRLRDHDARAGADRDEQQRLDQLVRAVAGEDAVGAPAREAGERLEQLPRVEVRVARPGARERLLEHAPLQRLRQVPGVLVLVDLDRGLARGQRVGGEGAHGRLDVAQRVASLRPRTASATLCAWPGKPSAIATRTTSVGHPREARPRQRHEALPALEVAHRERRGEARGAPGRAARGSGRCRSRPRPPATTGPTKTAPATIRRATRDAPVVITSTCSGASAFTAATPSSRSRHEDDRRRGARAPGGRSPRWRPSRLRPISSRATSAASSRDVVTSTTVSSPLPCSACASRSAATKPGVGGVVGQDRDLARPGLAVDLDPSAHQPLRRPRRRRCRGPRSCPRPERSVSRRRAPRSPAPRPRGRRAPRRRRRESPPPRPGSRSSVRGGVDDDEPRHAGHPRRDRVHQHGGGVGAGAARARTGPPRRGGAPPPRGPSRPRAAAGSPARAVAGGSPRPARAMARSAATSGRPPRRASARISRGGDAQLPRREPDAVEPLREAHERRVALAAHGAHDRLGRAHHGRAGRARPRGSDASQRFQPALR